MVADDCALEGKGIAGRRGIAGTVFVHKVRNSFCTRPVTVLSCLAAPEARAGVKRLPYAACSPAFGWRQQPLTQQPAVALHLKSCLESHTQVAGAAAAAGLSLADVRAETKAAAAAVGSMGVATRACALPGAQPSDR